jgi:hypothetical protein
VVGVAVPVGEVADGVADAFGSSDLADGRLHVVYDPGRLKERHGITVRNTDWQLLSVTQ